MDFKLISTTIFGGFLLIFFIIISWCKVINKSAFAMLVVIISAVLGGITMHIYTLKSRIFHVM